MLIKDPYCKCLYERGYWIQYPLPNASAGIGTPLTNMYYLPFAISYEEYDKELPVPFDSL
jgi:hypothetical protein